MRAPLSCFVSSNRRLFDNHLDDYAKSMTADLGLPDKCVNMVNYAYTGIQKLYFRSSTKQNSDYNGQNRVSDWFIRTKAAYMATDWRYAAGMATFSADVKKVKDSCTKFESGKIQPIQSITCSTSTTQPRINLIGT